MSDNALLLGFLVPDSIAESIFKIDPSPAVQTHKFGWSLARALVSEYGSLKAVSFLPVQSYPLVPALSFKGESFSAHGVEGNILGFVNILAIKHLTRFFGLLLQLPKILSCWRITIAYVHGVHTPHLVFGLILRFFGVKFVPVITDPPGVVMATDGLLARLLKSLDKRIVGYMLGRSSAIITLSPALASGYLRSIPVLVTPGILNSSWVRSISTVRPADRAGQHVVLYAGGLNRAYGIDLLIEAAGQLPDVTFLFFGKGDMLDEIQSSSHRNIVYGGFIGSGQLASQVLSADILVNPRPSDLDFAEKSFPSKLIEYAASGRPVLTTRIKSIPSEMSDIFYYIDDESSLGIAAAIKKVLSIPEDQRDMHARNARQVVELNYSEAAIGKKILELTKIPDSND